MNSQSRINRFKFNHNKTVINSVIKFAEYESINKICGGAKLLSCRKIAKAKGAVILQQRVPMLGE